MSNTPNELFKLSRPVTAHPLSRVRLIDIRGLLQSGFGNAAKQRRIAAGTPLRPAAQNFIGRVTRCKQPVQTRPMPVTDGRK